MRHPFDGIIVPSHDQNEHATSRRQMLQALVAAGALPLAGQLALADEAAPEIKPDEAEPKPGYRLYFVVPRDANTFSMRRRMELSIQGTFLPGLEGNKELAAKPGFLAWLNEAQAGEVAKAEDVTNVHKIEPADVVIKGTPPEKGPATLRVHAAPFDWGVRPADGTYWTMDGLGAQWQKEFAMHEGVTVVANNTVRQPFIQFADKRPEEVLKAIQSNPQVYALQWMTPVLASTRREGEEGGAVTTDALREEAATTFAIGEEGGSTEALGEEGATTGGLREEGATTLRVGEEGASTRALGEEGGVTTRALGEEGGSTERLGEEGGVTTEALGEEGGVSTRARGEEGGISTKALGEEGGVTTMALGEEGGKTTGALGEEGGGIKPLPAPAPMPEPKPFRG
jgi:hypothetical protein